MKRNIHINGTIIKAEIGANVRQVLIRHGQSPHNAHHYLSCQGIGSCGTCAIEVESGNAGVPTVMEKWRLRFPPHKKGPNPMRLACQVTLTEDLHIRKHNGFWGNCPMEKTTVFMEGKTKKSDLKKTEK